MYLVFVAGSMQVIYGLWRGIL